MADRDDDDREREPNTRQGSLSEPPRCKYYIHRGRGLASKRQWVVLPSRDWIPAEQWEARREIALAAKHSELTAANLNDRTIGEAFSQYVIQGEKVQATGKWLELEIRQVAPLYDKGRYPIPVVEEWQHPYGIGPWSIPKLKWSNNWPFHLDENKLFKIFASQYRPLTYCTDDLTERPIYHAVKALADRHRAFLDLLRNKELIAEGIFQKTQDLEVPTKIFGLRDYYLNIESHDLRLATNQGSGGQYKSEVIVVYESVTVRPANAAQSAATIAKTVTQVAAETSAGSPPVPSPPPALERAVFPLATKKRGPRETASAKVATAIRLDLKEGRLSPKQLDDMIEKVMMQRYKASRNTCRKVRNAILLEINQLPPK
jgi:hypothetical protein